MAFIQKANGTGTTTASATLTVSAGSTLVAFCWLGSSSTPTLHSCADGQGSYTAQDVPIIDGGNSIWAQVFTLQNANAGSHTAVFTSDAGQAVEIELVELTAPTTGAVIGAKGLDQASPGTTTDALTSGSITNGGSASATLLAMCSDTSNVNAADCPAVGTGFTSRDSTADSTIGSWRLESKSVSASAAATFTAIDGASRFVTVAVMIAEPAGGAVNDAYLTMPTMAPPMGGGR